MGLWSGPGFGSGVECLRIMALGPAAEGEEVVEGLPPRVGHALQSGHVGIRLIEPLGVALWAVGRLVIGLGVGVGVGVRVRVRARVRVRVRVKGRVSCGRSGAFMKKAILRQSILCAMGRSLRLPSVSSSAAT